METNKLVYILLVFFIVTGFIGVIGSNVNDRVSIFTYADTFDRPDTPPVVYELTGYEFVSLTSVTNGTTTVPASNYTITEIDGANTINFTDNDIGGASYIVTYTAYKQGKLTGASAVMIALLTLLVVAGLIVAIRKKMGK